MVISNSIIDYDIINTENGFIAKSSNDCIIYQGSSIDEVQRCADRILSIQGPAAVMDSGEECDIYPKDWSNRIFTWLWRNAAPGSEITLINDRKITRQIKGIWTTFDENLNKPIYMSPDFWAPDIDKVKNFHFVKK